MLLSAMFNTSRRNKLMLSVIVQSWKTESVTRRERLFQRWISQKREEIKSSKKNILLRSLAENAN